MQRIIRAVGGIILLPLIAFLVWYFNSFYPHLSELNKIIANQEKTISVVSDIHKLAVIAETSQGIRNHALKLAYRELVFDRNTRSHMHWHANTGLWLASSYLHFNNNEAFYLWSALVYSGEKGLQKSAMHLYGKELHDLNLRQKAELIAMVKAPDRLKLGSKALNERVNSILETIRKKN